MKTSAPERTTEQVSSLAQDAGMNYDMLAKALSVVPDARSADGSPGKSPNESTRVRITEFGRLVAELRHDH